MAILSIFIILVYGVIRSLYRENSNLAQGSSISPVSKSAKINRKDLQRALKEIDSSGYLYRYIIDVINHGSHQFNFPGGEMEGGYVPKDEAANIACYVMELGGHRCKHPYSADAAMYYSSVCAGCHGLKGKGLNGSYPDLTRSTLLGIQKRKERLQRLLDSSLSH